MPSDPNVNPSLLVIHNIRNFTIYTTWGSWLSLISVISQPRKINSKAYDLHMKSNTYYVLVVNYPNQLYLSLDIDLLPLYMEAKKDLILCIYLIRIPFLVLLIGKKKKVVGLSCLLSPALTHARFLEDS